VSSSKWGNVVTAAGTKKMEEYLRAADSFQATGDSAVIDVTTLDGVAIKTDPVEFPLPDFTEKVRAGMDLLDKILPGWQDSIDLTLLDLESDQMCVLGQTWPLYAKMHGLLEEGDYKQFADAVLSVGGDGDRNLMAASIGCAMDQEVFDYLNGFTYRQIEQRYGLTPQLLDIATIADAQKDPQLMEAVNFFNQCNNRQNTLLWEHLTRTWVREITKAREEGRWDQSSVSASPATEEVTTSQ